MDTQAWLNVDPANFTRFDRTDNELEAMLLFSVLVAGKAALPTARATERFLNIAIDYTGTTSRRPFEILEPLTAYRISLMLKEARLGCYNQKCTTVYDIVHRGMNLRTCTVRDLESIKGIGPKTARMFLLHSRPDQRLAVLDTHILAELRELGYEAPSATPGSRRRYAELEAACLQLADEAGQTPADWDLGIWRRRSGATILR